MNKLIICRICLSKQDAAKYKILTSEETHNNVPILSMIKLCIPELDINVQVHPKICCNCIHNLSDFYQFKTMCLENDLKLKYSNFADDQSFNKINKSVPSTKSDILSTSNKMLSDGNTDIDVSKNNLDQSDVNQNEISTNANSLVTNPIKRRKFTFYRNRFVNSNCAGCKNRILDVKYHNKVDNGYYDCFNCGKHFTSIADMRKHIYTHTLSYKCDICGKKWRGKYSLDIHLRSHTKQKSFECPVCNKKFVQSYSLHQHLSLHQEQDGNNKNRCLVCDKILSTKYNLKIHMTTHNSDSKPRCPNPKCNKWFYTQAAFIKHSENCLFNIGKEESEDLIEPEFIKTEVPDNIKKELDDNNFLEGPSIYATDRTALENLKSEGQNMDLLV